MSDTNPLLEGCQQRLVEPVALVIFGATGDLTSRKLIPALYNLFKEGLLPLQFACIGFARRKKSNEEFRSDMKESVTQFSEIQSVELSLWDHFQEHLYYHSADFHKEEGYLKLKTTLELFDLHLGTKGNRIFYLATAPSFFTIISEKLYRTRLIYDYQKQREPWSRIIIEKPFGHNYGSAYQIQKILIDYMDEKQIYRIDHYLGKETVQNILVLRFANSIFESLLNHRYIDHVQITVAEDQGIGNRGKFWEEAGLLRDMVQNHMIQLLSLVAMEPPVNLEAKSIRDEKVKALQSIRPLKLEETVRGQYGAGLVNGISTIGYREEKEVAPFSVIETYAALKVQIDNWRWAGVPFYLRGGKRLPKKSTEIAVIFKDPPYSLFQNGNRFSNVLAIRIQPDEGASLKINCKTPGISSPIQPVKMDFRYGSYFGITTPEAYERLICDCMLGDSTLFAREDEVLLSWQLCTPILEQWGNNFPNDFPNYPSGSWGPIDADQLLEREGRKWRMI